MSIVWQQRIRHFDRAVKPTKMRGMRLQMLKAEVRKKRKLPSQGHSGEYVFGSLEVRRKKRRGEDTTQAEKKLLFMRLRERMLWRKRLERRLAERSRRPSFPRTAAPSRCAYGRHDSELNSRT